MLGLKIEWNMIVYYKIYASISGGAAVSDLRGCCNNLPHTQWLKTPETCFLTNLEAMGMKLSLPPHPGRPQVMWRL